MIQFRYKKQVNERENKMIKGTKTVTIHNFTFEYIPSMRVMNVTSPTGGIEVHHNLSYEQANEIVGEILQKNMDCA
jgi:hypothetical protein|tara:strand:+ start:485 stop:712 length:228 start_codon:yes stop_codon:yes gene_type:complete